MKIIPFHNKISLPVEHFEQIREDVEAMHKLIIEVINGRRSVALHHSQVSEAPYNFFVVHPEIVAAGFLRNTLIVNPEIDKDAKFASMAGERRTVREGCMSFTLRPEKKMLRYAAIDVIYQTYDKNKRLTEHREVVTGLAAQIFQHECEHAKGRNIYQK